VWLRASGLFLSHSNSSSSAPNVLYLPVLTQGCFVQGWVPSAPSERPPRRALQARRSRAEAIAGPPRGTLPPAAAPLGAGREPCAGPCPESGCVAGSRLPPFLARLPVTVCGISQNLFCNKTKRV